MASPCWCWWQAWWWSGAGVSARPTDPGLSNERTALAWQRTALSLGSSGPAAAIVPVLATALGGWVFGESARRYLRAHRAQLQAPPRGGRAPTATALATVLLCATEVAVLLAH